MSKKQNSDAHRSLDTILQPLSAAHGRMEQTREAVESTPKAKAALQAEFELADQIRLASEKATSVEELIAIEEFMQKVDSENAKTEQDKKIVETSIKEYWQFSTTMSVIREKPDEYIRYSMNHTSTNGDPKKILKQSSLVYPAGTIAVMRKRALFASPGVRAVLDARIALAQKTIDAFKALHEILAEKFEQRQRNREKREAKKQQNRKETIKKSAV